jgi:hypothetical protein
VAQPAASEPHFLNLMGTERLPAILDVHERLQSDPPWRDADIGCGLGWSGKQSYNFCGLRMYSILGSSLPASRKFRSFERKATQSPQNSLRIHRPLVMMWACTRIRAL